MIDRIKQFMGKHIGIILIIVIIVCLLIPVFVCLCYDLLPLWFGKALIKTNITADGMLGYLGASIGCMVAVSIALIGVYREKKHDDENECLRIDNRRREIKPHLQVKLKSREDGTFDVVFYNHNNIALDVYFIDRNVLPYVRKGQQKTIKVCFDFSKDIFDAYYFECEMNGDYPEFFWIFYKNIDGNVISEKFQHYFEDGKHFYESTELGYES